MKQGIMEVSAAQRYPLGTRYAKDERVFRYGRAGNVSSLTQSYGLFPAMTFTESAVAAAASAVGALKVTCPAQGAVAVDEFAGGYLVVSSGAEKYPYYRIKSNTAAEAGETFVVTLEDALHTGKTGLTAITSGAETITLYKSPWAVIRSAKEELASVGGWTGVICVALVTVPKLNYFWGQTWGPAAFSGFNYYGDVLGQRAMGFDSTGAVVIRSIEPDAQYAGFLLPYTDGVAVPGAATLIFLQIAP